MADGSGVVIRRQIKADNSCLFNAVGYVMDHSKTKASELRQVVAAVVSGDPETYNDSFLEKPNADYCEWIMNPDHWGGAIELKILSEFYNREIAAYDIQTMRCDIYGQGKGFQERVMLIYDGLHYDALAVAPFEEAPEEVDQTIFTINSKGSIGPPELMAQNLVGAANKAKNYTDTSKFTLRCGFCQQGVEGEKGAIEHARTTGHQNFQEYT